jgi:hypothetical protein
MRQRGGDDMSPERGIAEPGPHNSRRATKLHPLHSLSEKRERLSLNYRIDTWSEINKIT